MIARRSLVVRIEKLQVTYNGKFITITMDSRLHLSNSLLI